MLQANSSPSEPPVNTGTHTNNLMVPAHAAMFKWTLKNQRRCSAWSPRVLLHEEVGETILGRLCVLPPLLETSLVLTRGYEKAECWSRPKGFLHTECGCYMVCLSLTFFAAVKAPPSESGLGVESG